MSNELPRTIIELFRENFDKGDKWGSVMSYLSPVCELYRRHFGVLPNDYSPSPFEYLSPIPAEYGEDSITTELWDMYQDGEIDSEEISYAVEILDHYRDLLVAADLDY